jgi:tRNA1Val (adenine37-N6)-methyltransferase
MNNLQLTKIKTIDTSIYQPVKGYKFSLDSLMLADFVRLRHDDAVVDMGAGCGVISIILAKRHPGIKIYAIEIQDEMAEIARQNIQLTDLSEKITILCSDFRCRLKEIPAGSVDHIVTNPPYRSAKNGLLCRDDMELIARHEICMELEELIEASKILLRSGGRLSIVYPSDLTARLMFLMKNARIEPKRMQLVHPRKDSKGRIVLIEGCKDAGEELIILPPIFVNE